MNTSISKRSFLTISAAAIGFLIAGCSTRLDMLPQGTVSLSGKEQVPVVDTLANGKGLFTVTSNKIISGSIKTDLVSPTAVHIHYGPRGRNGPVVLPLVQTGYYTWSVADNTRLTDTQYVQYIAGDFYVNVHSEAYPDGEIRGQLLAN